MACNTCSKMRCKLLAKAAGKKVEIKEVCGVADVCHIGGDDSWTDTVTTGSTWKTFIPYLMLVRNALIARMYKATRYQSKSVQQDIDNKYDY